jgi:hypothetical protein
MFQKPAYQPVDTARTPGTKAGEFEMVEGRKTLGEEKEAYEQVGREESAVRCAAVKASGERKSELLAPWRKPHFRRARRFPLAFLSSRSSAPLGHHVVDCIFG